MLYVPPPETIRSTLEFKLFTSSLASEKSVRQPRCPSAYLNSNLDSQLCEKAERPLTANAIITIASEIYRVIEGFRCVCWIQCTSLRSDVEWETEEMVFERPNV